MTTCDIYASNHREQQCVKKGMHRGHETARLGLETKVEVLVARLHLSVSAVMIIEHKALECGLWWDSRLKYERERASAQHEADKIARPKAEAATDGPARLRACGASSGAGRRRKVACREVAPLQNSSLQSIQSSWQN